MTEPLSSQLSRTLVAFTIEADDEVEHRIPHRTTSHGATAGHGDHHEAPWLVSSLMWSMCLRFIPADGTSVRSYARSAWWLTPKGISTTLRRMAGWWNYLSLDDPAEPGPAANAKAARIIRPTPGGRRAQEAWAPLTEQIEGRWRDRLGPAPVGALRSALHELVSQIDRPLPDCLRLYEVDLDRRPPARLQVATALPGLLAQAVLAFELDFEAAFPIPLAICGNVLRVLGEAAPGGIPVKDLAARTGLARDGAEANLRVLERRKLVTVGTGPGGGRLRVGTLTRAGVDRHQQATALTAAIEDRWRDRYGQRCLEALAGALLPVAGQPGDPDGPLWAGLYRYPDGWRSSLPRPGTLPRHPAVSHRGGYLDGA